MVETLFFDLDNTLLDFNRAERAAIAKTLKSFHIAPEPSVLKRYSELNLAQWKLLEQGKITRDQVKLRRFRLLFAELNVDVPAKEAAHTYETLLAQGHYFIDGAEELLETLYGQYRMYLVTNGTLRDGLKVPESPVTLRIFLSPKNWDTINRAGNTLTAASPESLISIRKQQ